MITASHTQLMAQYNEWMNSRLYAVCASLPDMELRKDRGAFFQSIYGTLNHIAYGDLAYLSRFTGDPGVVPEVGADLFGTFGRLSAQRSSHINSALVTGQGPVALKTPAAPSRSTHQRTRRQKSRTWSQLIY